MLSIKEQREVNVLSDREKSVLACVKTTKRQFLQILKRNQILLHVLDDQKSFVGYVGCPHCQAVTGICRNCAWAATVLPDSEHRRSAVPCCFACFGGVNLSEVVHGASFLRFGCNSEELCWDNPSEERILAFRTFLLGHIQWARAGLDKVKCL